MKTDNFSFPSSAKSILKQTLPGNIIQTRPGSRGSSLRYIRGYVVIDLLNKAFNYLWNWEILDYWTQTCEPFNNKNNGGKEPQGPISYVLGVLTVFLPKADGTFVEIKKQSFGAKAVVGSQTDQEDNFKSAATDALKKAASMFGIAAELYLDDTEISYLNSIESTETWPHDMKIKYKEELQYFQVYRTETHLDKNGLNNLVYSWSDGKFSDASAITPATIQNFISFLQQLEQKYLDDLSTKRNLTQEDIGALLKEWSAGQVSCYHDLPPIEKLKFTRYLLREAA